MRALLGAIAGGLPAVACCVSALAAEPADYVQVPLVVAGEREFDFKAGATRDPAGNRIDQASAAFGYGVNSLWFTEIYVKYQRAGPDAVRFDAVEWENKLQLTETGRYPVDLGILLETELPRDSAEGVPTSLSLLAQSQFGRLQLNGNLLLQRSFGNAEPQYTALGYQWQAEYRWLPQFSYGLQGFGDVGPWNHWLDRESQSHQLGPAIFGIERLGSGRMLRYNAAWLFGITTGAPSHTARLQAEFEF